METINIYLQVKSHYLPKVKYTFNTIFNMLGVKPKFFTEFTMQSIHIYYGEKTKEKYPLKIYHNTEAADFFLKKKLYEESEVNLVKYGMEYIPFLFSQQGEIIHFTNKSATIRKDLISSAFYFLSCWQEYASPKLIEPSNFFAFADSLQYKHGFAEIPVVDRYCEILHRTLNHLFSEYNSENLWNEKKFALSLSYNIDYWHFWTDPFIKSLRERQDKLFSKKNIQKWLRILIHKVGTKLFDSNFIMNNILAHERSRKLSSSCFLLSHDSFPDERMNYFSDENIQAEVLRVLKNCSINLQGTKEAGYQNDYLLDEIKKLDVDNLQGFRVRYMNFNYQNLFTILEKANISFDSSMGFYEAVGFRAGVSYPFYPYNIAEDRAFEVLEVPIAFTDRALYKLTKGNARLAKHKVYELMKTASIHRTHISIVWHNHLFDKIDYPGWGNLYWKINKFDKNKYKWVCSVNQMVEFWKSR